MEISDLKAELEKLHDASVTSSFPKIFKPQKAQKHSTSQVFCEFCASCGLITDVRVATWIKRLGFWGFLFFLVKGLLWLLVPALIALWTTS